MTLTPKDIDEIREVVKEEVEERTKNLPTKTEFFGKMDEVMGELKVIREEHAVSSHQLRRPRRKNYLSGKGASPRLTPALLDFPNFG